MLFLIVFLASVSAILGQNSNGTTHIVTTNTTIVCPSTDIDSLRQINIELKETIIQMWNSLNTRLDKLEARLSCLSNCSVPQVTNSTVIPPTPKLQERIYQNLTIDGNWILVYDEAYSHPTMSTELQSAAYTCSNQVIVGARRNDTNSQLALAAVGPLDVLQHRSAWNTPVQFGEVYWYSTSPKSFGFSPSQAINQNTADVQDQTSSLRLSWHLDQSDGGYRAGSVVNLNTNTTWHKVIYCVN